MTQNEWSEIHIGCNVWTCAAETCDTVLVSAKNLSNFVAKVHISFAGSTNINVRSAAVGTGSGADVVVVLPPQDTAAVAMITPEDRSRPYIVMYATQCDMFSADALPSLLHPTQPSSAPEEDTPPTFAVHTSDTDAMMSALNVFCDNVVDSGERQSTSVGAWVRSRVSTSPFPVGTGGGGNEPGASQLRLCGRNIGTDQIFEIAPNSDVFIKACPSVDDAITFEVENNASHGVSIAFDLRASGSNISHVALTPSDSEHALLFTVFAGQRRPLLLVYPRNARAPWQPTIDFRWRWVYQEMPRVATDTLRATPFLGLVRETNNEQGNVTVFLENKSDTWVHCTLNFATSKNAVFEPGPAMTTSIAPNLKKQILVMSPQDAALPWEIAYTCSWTDGVATVPQKHVAFTAITELIGDGLEMIRHATVAEGKATVELVLQHRGVTPVHVLVDLTATTGCEFMPSEFVVTHPGFSLGLRVIQCRLVPGVMLDVAKLLCSSHALLSLKYDVRWCDADAMSGQRMLPWPESSPYMKLF